MVEFTEWFEAGVLIGIFAFFIVVPCVLVTRMGLKFIYELGCYPSRTPIIQMGIFYKLLGIETLTFCAWVAIAMVLIN